MRYARSLCPMTENIRLIPMSYYIANEGFSILENWGAMGLPLPEPVRNALAKLKKEDSTDEDK